MNVAPTLRIGITAVAALAVAGLAACTTTPAGDDDAGRDLVIGVAGIGQSWNPLDGSGILWTIESSQAVYEGLVRLNTQTIEYDPVLAEEYSVSDDKRTLSIRLREGITFTDGEPLTAEAVKKTFDGIMETGMHFSATEFVAYDPVVEVTGELELEIRTTAGINDRFFNSLTYLPIVSPAALDDPELLTREPVGTGPYVLGELVPDVSVTYVRNPEYWNPDAYDFDSITFQVFADRIAAANAVRSGQIDLAQVDRAAARDIESSGVVIHTGAGAVQSLVWMDREGLVNPPLADKRVRQAISHAFDRETIVDTLLDGYGSVSSQPFTEGQAAYIEGGNDRYPFDIEKAKELLAEAGYPDGFDVVIPSTPALFMQWEPLIQQTLADIGIRVTYEVFSETADWSTAVYSSEYALIQFDMNDAFWISYLSDAGALAGNGRGPANPAIAGILDRIDNGDAEESAEASQELGEFLLEEVWYIPFARGVDTWASRPGIDFAVGRLAGWPTQLIDISIAE